MLFIPKDIDCGNCLIALVVKPGKFLDPHCKKMIYNYCEIFGW